VAGVKPQMLVSQDQPLEALVTTSLSFQALFVLVAQHTFPATIA